MGWLEMIEWVLIIWVLLPGENISDPVEIGSYRVEADCIVAAEIAVVERIGSKQGAVTAVCVPRDK